MTETSATNRQQRFRKGIRFRSAPSAQSKDNHAFSDEARYPPKVGFRPDIEGLRAVAVLAVIFFHSGLPGVDGGFTGVDVFFVISGFLITGMLRRQASTSGSIRLLQFYGGRARRLLPASATVGVIVMTGWAVLLPPLQARTVIGDGIASALYVANYRFALQGIDYLTAPTPSPFQHYWSLGVEEQFYLVWPPLIIGTTWLIRRARRRFAANATFSEIPYLLVLSLVGASSFAVSSTATDAAPSLAFFSLPTRAWELAAGGLVVLTTTQWRRLPALLAGITGWGGLALILLSCTLIGRATPYPGTAALLPVLGTVLVIGAGCAAPTRGCGRLLALPPMRAGGRLSYSWYLWHWPILLVLTGPPLAGHPVELTLAVMFVSGLLAALTLRLIENPLRFADALRGSAGASLALGAAATAVAVSVGLFLLVLLPTPVGHGPAAPPLTVSAGLSPTARNVESYDAAVQQMFAQVQATVAASADLKAVPSNLDPPLAAAGSGRTYSESKGCLLNFLQVDQPECASGDTSSSTTIALVGDSNAAMWSTAFQPVATQRAWRLETLSKGGCPLLNLPIFNAILHREYTECERWRGQVANRLQREHPALIVVSMSRRYGVRYDSASSFTAYDSAWVGSLARLVQQLRGTGAKVLVLGPIPDPNSWVANCLSGQLDNVAACSPPRSKAVNQSGIIAEAAATKAAGGQYDDLTELFCTAERCPAIVGNTLVYQNASHLTAEYVRLLAPVIGALTDRAFIVG